MAFFRCAKSSFNFLLNRVNYSMNSGHCYCSSAHREAYIAGVIQTRGLFTSQSASPSPHKSFKRSFSGGVPASEQMNLIKLLRERTSAPIKDVKSSLVDSNWDIEAAQKDLRKRGVVLASKKSSRTASEGLLALAQTENKAAIIELNCETDFVARNEIFQYLALSLARIALLVDSSAEQVSTSIPIGSDYLEVPDGAFSKPLTVISRLVGGDSSPTDQSLKINLDHPKLSRETTVQSAIAEVAAIMGENVTLRRGLQMSSSAHGAVSSYLHSSPQPGLGRIAGVLTLEVEDDNVQLDALQEVGSQLAMHIVAAKPLFLSKELVSNEAIESERDILKSQAESSGKPQMAIEKMVEGRLRKYFEDVVFMEQKFVVNDTINVKSLLSDLSKKVGSPVKVGNFFRMEVGEGIQRLETSSASEGVVQAA